MRQISTFLKAKGMSLGGWKPSSCLTLFKVFLRPVMEYGIALDILPKEILATMQKAQNQSLRNMLSAAHTTSIAGMHALLNIPPVEFRNKHLFSKFHANIARISRSEDIEEEIERPVIVEMFKKQSEMLEIPNSLLGNSWNSTYWNEIHETEEQTPNPDPTIQTTELSREERLDRLRMASPRCVGKLQRKYIKKMIKKRGNVADNIRITDNKKAHPLISSEWIPRQTQTHLIFWRLGRVAYHQECLNCPVTSRQELSRQHALECANVIPMIMLSFPQLISDSNRTMMDIAMDQLAYEERDVHQLNTLADAVIEIKKKCLKWRVNEEGQLVSPSNVTYPQS
jgi:hypothetical protein